MVHYNRSCSGPQEKVASGKAVIELSLDKSGGVSLEGAGLKASGRMPGPLARQPIDGLQIGSDTGGTVAGYEGPFKFQGEINFVQIHVK